MDPIRYAQLFQAESQEHLSAINQALLALESGDASGSIEALFRSVHTLKGMSAAMGYTAVAELAHEQETLLDALRQGRTVTSDVVDALFASTDLLETAIARCTSGDEQPLELAPTVAHLRSLARRGFTPLASALVPPPSAFPQGTITPPLGATGRLIRVQLAPDTPLPGVRALFVLKRAEALGRLSAEVPARDALTTEDFTGVLSFRVETSASADEIARSIRAAGDVAAVFVDGAEVSPGPRIGAPSEHVSPGADAQSAEAPLTGKVIARTMRIDPARLDTLLDLTGELVIARGRLMELASGSRDAALTETAAEIARHVSALQYEILAARLVPVWQVLERFPRLVRDAARSRGKDVRFEIEGRDIELDRSLLDEIVDPLVHLLRNAVDHGIEQPAERKAAGKDPVGRILISAIRDRDTVLVRVSDDGRGIDRDRVLRRAREMGLVEGSLDALSDDHLMKLVTKAGFSTADAVTDLSGRGVGVDAVQSRIQSLGGTLEIDSTEGRGTTVTLRLPMTLAIVRAVIARVGTEVYALPAGHVAASGELTAATLTTIRGEPVVVIGDVVLPMVDLRVVVGKPSPDPSVGEYVVLEGADRRIGMLVDELTGQQEIVVKRFDGVREAIPLFSGATILGNGMPALIVDVGRLL